MSQEDRIEPLTLLSGCEDVTPELASGWEALFSAAWCAYDRLIERRRTAARAADPAMQKMASANKGSA
jgi:hypothetical protein